jgi:hypothetical protein
MNQATAGITRSRTGDSRPDHQEPLARERRRSQEDGQTANLLEAQGRGGPLDLEPDPRPSPLRAKSKWRKQVDDAGALWRKLTEGDLQQFEDHERTLAELIQDRYGVRPQEADRQVMHFIEDHQSSSL